MRLHNRHFGSRLLFLAIIAFVLGGCGRYLFVSDDGNDSDSVNAQVISDEDGKVAARIDPDRSVNQLVRASEDSQANGSVITFPPGSLGEPTTIVVSDGPSGGAEVLASYLNLDPDTEIGQPVSPIAVAATTAVDALKPFKVSFKLEGSAGLRLAGSYPIVAYLVTIQQQEGRKEAGIIPTSAVTVEDGTASFESSHFGVYQLLYVPSPVEQAITADVVDDTIIPRMTGSWNAQDCIDWEDDLWMKIQWRFAGTEFEAELSQFTDDSCSEGGLYYRLVHSGVFTITDAEDSDDPRTFNIDLEFNDSAIVPFAATDTFNDESLCGVVNWRSGDMRLTTGPEASGPSAASELYETLNNHWVEPASGTPDICTEPYAVAEGTIVYERMVLRGTGIYFHNYGILDQNSIQDASQRPTQTGSVGFSWQP